jgi:ADP-ribose pyrophosphatase
MSDDPLKETELTTETVYRGNLLHVCRDTVRLPNGADTAREYIVHPGAVLIVPILDDGRLVFERQYRYPLRRSFIELPAGKIDPNEDILTTGKRELLEETGYTAKEWRYLAALHPCIGYSDEIIHIYLASGLQAGQKYLDEDETLEVFTMTLEDALQALKRGEITDGKTVIALFWAEKHLSGEWLAAE